MNKIMRASISFLDFGTDDIFGSESYYGRYHTIVNRVILAIFLSLGFIFVIDAFFWGRKLSSIFRYYFPISEFDPITMYCVFSTLLTLPFGILSALIFFLFFSHNSGRYEVGESPKKGFLLPMTIDVVKFGLLAIASIYAGFLAGIQISEALGLALIPGFFVIQIILISQCLALASVNFCRVLLLLLPLDSRAKLNFSNLKK